MDKHLNYGAKFTLKVIIIGFIITATACSTFSKGVSLKSTCDFEFKGNAQELHLSCTQNNGSKEGAKSAGTVHQSIGG